MTMLFINAEKYFVAFPSDILRLNRSSTFHTIPPVSIRISGVSLDFMDTKRFDVQLAYLFEIKKVTRR